MTGGVLFCPAHLCSSAHLSHISLVSTSLLPASLLLRLIPLASSARTDACVVPSLFAGFCPRVSPVSPACHALPFPGGSESLCFFCYFPPRSPFVARFCRLPIVHSFWTSARYSWPFVFTLPASVSCC